MAMKSIFVVCLEECEYEAYLGHFSTAHKAQKYLDKINEDEDDNYYIKEIQLDEQV